MTPFEKLTGCKPRNRITNNLGLENLDSTLVTFVKSPNEQLQGSQRLDALQLAEFESSRTWGRSRNEQKLKRFVNEQVKNRKRTVRKFIVEKNGKKKGWDSKFGCKPKMISGETTHTVRVEFRILHKKDVAEVPETVVNNLFQQSKPEDLAQTKKKEIFTGTGGRFVLKDTKGAKSATVDTISPDIKLKRLEEKSQTSRTENLRQMIADSKAKKAAQNLEVTESTENQSNAAQLLAKPTENGTKKENSPSSRHN